MPNRKSGVENHLVGALACQWIRKYLECFHSDFLQFSWDQFCLEYQLVFVLYSFFFQGIQLTERSYCRVSFSEKFFPCNRTNYRRFLSTKRSINVSEFLATRIWWLEHLLFLVSLLRTHSLSVHSMLLWNRLKLLFLLSMLLWNCLKLLPAFSALKLASLVLLRHL